MIIWKDIKNYEGKYQVSNTGLVKSLERTIKNSRGGVYTQPERILKVDDSNKTTYTKYLRVTLSSGSITKRFSVHRLVGTYFVSGQTEERDIINHIDNDATNNHHENLEWVTHSENMVHAQKQGRLHTTQSKAGKKAGALARARRISKMEALVGTQVNGWTVGDKFSNKGKHFYIESTCICGRVKPVAYETLHNGTTKACSIRCGKEFST